MVILLSTIFEREYYSFIIILLFIADILLGVRMFFVYPLQRKRIFLAIILSIAALLAYISVTYYSLAPATSPQLQSNIFIRNALAQAFIYDRDLLNLGVFKPEALKPFGQIRATSTWAFLDSVDPIFNKVTVGIIDTGVEYSVIEKSGSWFVYKGEKLGQGMDNSKAFLRENPKISEEIKKAIKNRTISSEKNLFLVAEENKNLLGVNYWTSFGASTQIWDENGNVRKFGDVLKKYYQPKIFKGIIKNEIGYPLKGVAISTDERSTHTNEEGTFSLPYIEDDLLVKIWVSGYKEDKYLIVDKQDVVILLKKEKEDALFKIIKNIYKAFN